MTTYWAEHACLPTGFATAVRIGIEGDRFRSIQSRANPRPGDVRLPGVVLPGLANAHSHAFHRALRGRTHNGAGNFWSWRDGMYAVAQRLNPESYLALARATYAEMALAGITVVGEFHYVHHRPGGGPYDDPNAMGAALTQAALDAGIRLTLLDTCYLTGGLTADGHLPLDEVQTRFSDGSVGAWAERAGERKPSDLVRLGAAIHSVRAVPRDAAAGVAESAREMPLHVHVSEQQAENLACQMFYGRTPTGLLADIGVLGPDLTAVHATHLTDADIVLLGRSGSQVAFCPTTERDLADGVGRARDLADAGVRLSLGSDQHAVIDPFEEARGLEMHERLTSNERGRFETTDLLRAATADGYRSLGWSDGGRIATGALADLVSVRHDSVRTVGSKASQILYCATAADVHTVVVGGRVIVEDGHHLLGPVAPLLRDALDLLRDDG